jgi:hypothetical protein
VKWRKLKIKKPKKMDWQRFEPDFCMDYFSNSQFLLHHHKNTPVYTTPTELTICGGEGARAGQHNLEPWNVPRLASTGHPWVSGISTLISMSFI